MKRTVFALAAAVLVASAVFATLKLSEGNVPEVEPAQVATAPTAAPPPAAPAAEPRVEFQKKLDSAQESLPTSEKIQALPAEQVHFSPQPLIDASFEIGEVAATIAKNPALAPQGLEFYGKCARRGELAISVRAHCLHNLRALSKSRNEAPDESGIAEGVLKLEDRKL